MRRLLPSGSLVLGGDHEEDILGESIEKLAESGVS